MSFHSLDFLVFLTVVLAIYWSLSRIWQNAFLVVSSCLFYGYIHPWFLIPFLVTTLVDFFCALGMVRRPSAKAMLRLISLIANLGLLAIFKYFHFFLDNINHVLSRLHLSELSTTFHVLLPVGISFYTFQSLSYIFEVYAGRIQPRSNLLDYAVYVSFWPQLVAGPIERPGHILPQVERERVFNWDLAQSALLLLLWGFYKKLVIADTMALMCNKIFALQKLDWALLWVGVFCFAIQIFADFSAYTDIARGCARLLGFELMANFDHPYLARSPIDFWRRWHISLSTWFRDYVYFPLGGARVAPNRAAMNVVVVFLLSGLWHGASWNFVIWGLYWALLVLAYREIEPMLQANKSFLFNAIQPVVMFMLTCVGWLIFRETDLGHLVKYFTLSPFAVKGPQFAVASHLLVVTLLYSAPIWIHMYAARTPEASNGSSITSLIRSHPFEVCCVLFLGILTLRSPTTANFIYFQF